MRVEKNQMSGENKEKIAIKTIKVIIWLSPVFLLLWLANQYILPSGKMKVVYDVTRPSPLVRNFASKEVNRLIGTKNQKGDTDYFQLILQNPLYFDVVVPRTFQSAKVTLEYQNPNNQPVIQAGLQQSNKVYYNQDLAYSSDVLNNLPFYWQKIEEGSVVLWQKNTDYFQTYKAAATNLEQNRQEIVDWKDGELRKIDDERYALNSTDTFTESKQVELAKKEKSINSEYEEKINNLLQNSSVAESLGNPRFSKIADFIGSLNSLNKDAVVSYNYNLLPFLKIANYSPASATTNISKTLRGKHEIYTYLGFQETLSFQITVQDINGSKGADPVSVSLFNADNKKIEETKLEDDGQTDSKGVVKPAREIQLRVTPNSEGIYRILIDVNDDIFIKNISSNLRYLSFKGRVYLVDNPEYRDVLVDKEVKPTTLYTNSTTVNAQTAHEANLQTVKVNGQNLVLQKVQTPVAVSNLKDITTISSPLNDVNIQGNAYFSFEKNQLFNPGNPDLSVVNKKNVDDFDFIIATYPQGESNGDWLVATTTFDSNHMYFDRGQDLIAHFIISLPGLPENHRTLKVKSITVEFARPPTDLSVITNKIKSYFKK
jgi:hypothetical protein